MRSLSLSLVVLFAFSLLFSAPAMAGKVSSADGKIVWTPTECKKPEPPSALPKNPEAKANDLNARMAAYNQYVGEAQSYMDCVSKESQRDAESFASIIISSGQDVINQTQSDVSLAAVAAKSSGK